MRPTFLWGLGVCALILGTGLCPVSALADVEEIAVGVQGEGSTWGGRLQLGGEAGVSDWIATRVWLGVEHVDGFAAVGHWEMLAQLDALKWVPALSLGVGMAVGDGFEEPRILANLGGRRYLDIDRSILIRAGGEWRPDRWLATVSVAYWWHWQ